MRAPCSYLAKLSASLRHRLWAHKALFPSCFPHYDPLAPGLRGELGIAWWIMGSSWFQLSRRRLWRYLEIQSTYVLFYTTQAKMKGLSLKLGQWKRQYRYIIYINYRLLWHTAFQIHYFCVYGIHKKRIALPVFFSRVLRSAAEALVLDINCHLPEARPVPWWPQNDGMPPLGVADVFLICFLSKQEKALLGCH